MKKTITEVAEELKIKTTTIRYYDKLGLLNPLERKSGHRIFSQDDIDRLVTILCLKNTGMSIDNIKKFLELYKKHEHSVEEKIKMIEQQKNLLEEKISILNQYKKQSEFKMWFFKNKVIDGVEPPYSAKAYAEWKKEFEEDLAL